MPTRRQVLIWAATSTALAGMAGFARAQAYPAKPVRILVGFVAGGNFDIVGRLIAQSLSEQLHQPFIVENRPGASSNLATEAVVRAPAAPSPPEPPSFKSLIRMTQSPSASTLPWASFTTRAFSGSGAFSHSCPHVTHSQRSACSSTSVISHIGQAG